MMLLVIGLMAGRAWTTESSAAEVAGTDAWQTLPAYRSGTDMAPMLAIQAEANRSLTPPEARVALAARLAAVLGQPEATADARRFVCQLLRQVGTPAQVPILAQRLTDDDFETSDAARQAIESIPGTAATEALLDLLPRVQGRLRLGVIAALGRRRDAAAVPALGRLVEGGDPEVVGAAAGSLALIADESARATLMSLAERSRCPTPAALHEPLLRAAEAAARAGDSASAAAIHDLLARPGQPAAARQAALKGRLDTGSDGRQAIILAWLAADDPDRRLVAVGDAGRLDEAALTAALEQLDRYAPEVRPAILTLAARRIPRTAEPTLIRLATGTRSDLQVAAIECLGRLGSSVAVPTLVAVLMDDAPAEQGSAARAAARAALAALPRDEVGPRLVETLSSDASSRPDIVELLGEIHESKAWDALARLAVAPEPAPWRAALDGLTRLAAPEAGDLGRLVDLLAAAPTAERSEAVARAIALVARKGASSDAVADVLAALDRRGIPADVALPLLGRLGGPVALARIDAALASPDAKARTAATEGLCHWPDAGVADRLLALARQTLTEPGREQVGRQALRAYVRTVSLRSDREPAATLEMLREAMALCGPGPVDERSYVIERTAAAVRTMDAVDWIAGYLDAPETAQAACRGLVELAHHKQLRRPNLARFEPLLERVVRIADDPAVATRAARYRLGL